MRGLDRFRDFFSDFPDQYVLIGGAASHLAFDAAGLDFRATQDLDIVLIVEALTPEFMRRFHEFIEAGGYAQKEKAGGGKELYRFGKPSDDTFPTMLELFSRQPHEILLPEEARLTPIPAEENGLSLSAMLLDDHYYEALQSWAEPANGITSLNPRMLIPFKAYAYLNLVETRSAGGRADSKHIRKHRNDVFNLLQLLDEGDRIELSAPLAADMKRFVDAVAEDQTFDPKVISLPGTREEQLARLRAAFQIE
jgi:hypothetical protein